MLINGPVAAGGGVQSAYQIAQSYAVIAFKGLAQGQRVQATAGSLALSVHLRPALRPGHQLQLYINGERHSTLATSAPFRVTGIERGNQTLQLRVFDIPSGRLVQAGSPVQLDVRRNINPSNRRKAPK
jgi:hypothetical protein